MRRSAITGAVFERHNREGHVENRDRLLAIIRDLPEDVPVHEPVMADPADIARVHDPGYLAWLRKQCLRRTESDTPGDCGCSGGYFEQHTFVSGFIDRNTYINPHSYEVAGFAAGSAVAAMERALGGESCFALVRPPGHHAGAAWAMGYCLLNNAAIAAAKALTSVDRVAIIDWDAHHGNGTQDIFYRDGRVLYCSIHNGDTFPRTGAAGETGAGPGAGFTVNAPVSPGSGIGDYAAVFSGVFLPALERFRPELLIISAGQDILADDPVGGMRIGPEDLAYLTGMLTGATSLAPALVLEGGYGPSHPAAVRNIFSALAGRRGAREIPAPGRNARDLVSLLRKLHRLA